MDWKGLHEKNMSSSKAVFVIIAMLAMLATCNAGMMESILEFFFGKKKSMSDIITDLLDELYPKDDKETKVMKEIFSMYNEDDQALFNMEDLVDIGES